MRSEPAFKRGNSAGVALVAVLWIVAALGILVTGMVQSHRDEIRLVSSARYANQASAVGNAAIQLALQRMVIRLEPVNRLERMEVNYAGQTIQVEVMPLNGLVDINRAQESLLARLFAVAGGLPDDAAAILAKRLVASRQPGQGRTSGPRYEVIEDLLQLPGIDFDLYARLSSVITTDALGNGRVNPMAAPQGVLAILSGGNPAQAAGVAAGRDAGQAGVDTTSLTAEFLDTTVTTRFWLQARVPLADGRRLLCTRLVDTARVANGRLPWRIFQTDDRIEPLTLTLKN